MSHGERYLFVSCPCGRTAMFYPSANPGLFFDGEVKPDIVRRLRCNTCRRTRGDGVEIRLGWHLLRYQCA